MRNTVRKIREETPELAAEEKYRLLLGFFQQVSGTLDLDEILNRLLDTVRPILEYDAGGIFVLNRGYLQPSHVDPRQLIGGIATRGFDSLETCPLLRLGEGIVGHVIRTGEPWVAPDVRHDPYYCVGRIDTRSEVAVPIISNDRTIGALDLESDKPGAFGESDLEVLRFFANAASISIEKAMLHREIVAKKRIEDQLKVAHEVQSRLLPSASPELKGYDIAGLSLPTFEIGGDCFDYIPLPEDQLGIVVADVAGKGIPAALIMATFRALLRAQPDRGEPARAMQAVNRLLREAAGLVDEPAGTPAFVSSVYGVLDAASGDFHYTNCGHNPPLLLGTDGSAQTLDCGGLPLGAFADSRYEAGRITLGREDTLVLYTDGVVETANGDGIEFGIDGLANAMRRSRHLPARDLIGGILQATRDFSRVDMFSDDFTLVAVKPR